MNFEGRTFFPPCTLRNMNPEKWNILYILFTAGAQQVSMNKFLTDDKAAHSWTAFFIKCRPC